MVHESKSPRKVSPVRTRTRKSSLRFKPTARQKAMTTGTTQTNQASCSTIYTLNVPEQPHIVQPLNNQTQPVLSSCVSHVAHPSGYNGEIKSAALTLTSRSEKLVLDKVEDMDIDHQSDNEKDGLDSDMIGTAIESGLQLTTQVSKDNTGEIKTERKLKKAIKQVTQISEKEKFPPTPKGKKTLLSDVESPLKIIKKKPIYIILHAALVRFGNITGKASSPIRIQAERIIIDIEVNSGPTSETLKLRIPFKELTSVQVNLSEPPYLMVVFINDKYSQTIINSSKKNGVLNKMKGDMKHKMVIQLTYDSIPKEVKQDLEKLHQNVSPKVQWDEISSSEATDIVNGKDIKDCIDAEEKEHEKERKVLKGQRNQKKPEMTTQEPVSVSEPPLAYDNVDKVPVSPTKPATTENPNKSSCSSETVAKRRRKRGYTETKTHLETDEGKVEVKVEEQKKDESLKEKCEQAPGGLSEQEEIKSDSVCFIHSQEQSFEERRLMSTQISNLESNVAEKTGLLNLRRRSLELKELQLEQERNKVRELRGSLREEQTTRRDLEARCESINSELLDRNSRNCVEKSRIEDMERELSQLNISLNDTRADNQRLVQEIHEVRERMTESEAALTSERETITHLQQDVERERTTLESLREEIREKDDELRQERGLTTEAVQRCEQLEQTLTSTTQNYEQRLRQSHEEHTRLGRQYNECNRTLDATRDELRDTNNALHRAQETIQEYSRMQPRDWTIQRDEIEISEKMLGQGAWGWVKEGTFRGTKVAVKQMHELIISPHNRRLFEREMHMAARCRHPNLLQFIGATNDNGLALLVTELLDTNLRTLLGQRSLCQDEVLTLSLDVAKALNYLHLNKPFPIIHRDISSTNVLLWKREEMWHGKLSDYGAVNFMRHTMTTSPGALIYAAPEAMTSQQSPKVDVFSFGLLLCEMCIRELPVPNQTNDQIRLITNGHLRDIVQRCTNTTADNRSTMQEVLSALEHLSSNITLGVVSVNNRQITLG